MALPALGSERKSQRACELQLVKHVEISQSSRAHPLRSPRLGCARKSARAQLERRPSFPTLPCTEAFLGGTPLFLRNQGDLRVILSLPPRHSQFHHRSGHLCPVPGPALPRRAHRRADRNAGPGRRCRLRRGARVRLFRRPDAVGVSGPDDRRQLPFPFVLPHLKMGSSPKRVGKTRSGLGLSWPFFQGFRHFLGRGNRA